MNESVTTSGKSLTCWQCGASYLEGCPHSCGTATNEMPVSSIATPQSWPHCPRCMAPMPTCYAGICESCEANAHQRAESYGGEEADVETRYARYRREWD